MNVLDRTNSEGACRLVTQFVPILSFQQEVESAEHLWSADNSRQTRIRVQRETSNIHLRIADRSVDSGVCLNDTHAVRDSRFAKHFPQICAWLQEFATDAPGHLGRATLVRLNPHGRVYPHIDEGEYYRIRDRYHLVLYSPGGSEMICGEQRAIFREGELWWFNNKLLHEAVNPSPEGRVHLIFDILSSSANSLANYDVPSLDQDENRLAPLSQLHDIVYPPIADVVVSELASTCESLGKTERLLVGHHTSEWLATASGPVAAIVRHQGREIGRAWSVLENRSAALSSVLSSLATVDVAEISSVDLILGRWLEDRDESLGHSWTNATDLRGLIGYLVTDRGTGESCLLLSHEVLHCRDRVNRQIASVAHNAFGAGATITARAFLTDQVKVTLCGKQSAVRQLRGRRLWGLKDVTRNSVQSLASLLDSYLWKSLCDDGRMRYLYDPCADREDQSRNNWLRQWMATWALCHSLHRTPSRERSELLRRNIDYNVRKSYRVEQDTGVIVDRASVKLGSAAIAVLALMDSPDASSHTEVINRLLRTIATLWRGDGAFQTFMRPEGRSDCQNFYPGEALLAWARLFSLNASKELLERFMTSFRYYQEWHSRHPNPAFVPWHTQAYVQVWKHTRDPALLRAVFAMNDWLAGIQQWDDAPFPDSRGRFFCPHRPFGPPHSSSNGVYLEGIASALEAALAVDDGSRVAKYSEVLRRGLQYIGQLTVEPDSWLGAESSAVGGVCTTEYDPRIRVDNVQHSVMAMWRIIDLCNDNDGVLDD